MSSVTEHMLYVANHFNIDFVWRNALMSNSVEKMNYTMRYEKIGTGVYDIYGLTDFPNVGHSCFLFTNVLTEKLANEVIEFCLATRILFI